MPDPRPLLLLCLNLWLCSSMAMAAAVADKARPLAAGNTADNPSANSPVRPSNRATWFDEQGPSQAARELFGAIARAPEHGLPPARYQLVPLQRQWQRWQQLRQSQRQARDRARRHPERTSSPDQNLTALFDSGQSLAELQVMLNHEFDRAFHRLATDLGRGMLNAASIQSRLYRPQPEVDTRALHRKISSGHWSVTQALASVAPTHPVYQRLVTHMQGLLRERAADRSRQSIDTVRPWKIAERGVPVAQLKRRLIQTGELPVDSNLSERFDAPTLVALKAFQKRHGLSASGVLDATTAAALNTSVQQEIERAALSLERWRWMPRDLGQRYLLVNVPDFRVVMMNGAQKILDMSAVVGKPEFSTPVFSREMSYLEINPTWTVPASITNRELIPLERKQPGYLRSHGFEFLERVDGRNVRIETDQMPPEAFNRNPFPYLLRQRPGPHNALGRMKFMMPNEHAIYLHDTLATHLFELDERAYSHGCVRVSQPVRLATILMLIDGRTASDIDTLLSSTSTRRVTLRTPVPTHMAYYTHWVDEHGRWQARPDVYGQNPALLAALRDVSRVAGRDPSSPFLQPSAAG